MGVAIINDDDAISIIPLGTPAMNDIPIVVTLVGI
jgi:hypothetical protein